MHGLNIFALVFLAAYVFFATSMIWCYQILKESNDSYLNLCKETFEDFEKLVAYKSESPLLQSCKCNELKIKKKELLECMVPFTRKCLNSKIEDFNVIDEILSFLDLKDILEFFPKLIDNGSMQIGQLRKNNSFLIKNYVLNTANLFSDKLFDEMNLTYNQEMEVLGNRTDFALDSEIILIEQEKLKCLNSLNSRKDQIRKTYDSLKRLVLFICKN